MRALILLCGAAVVMSTVTAHRASADWSERISLKGDFRFRFEYIDQDDRDETRERFRLRARLAATGQVNDAVAVKVRLASGSDDPVSTNQSLDGGFSSKNFNLDRAYLDIAPDSWGGLSIWAGKMKNPMISVDDLQWDGDLNPEGAALIYENNYGGEVTYLANLQGWVAEERSSDDDTYMFGGQIGAETEVEGISMLGAVGYYVWDSMQGFPTLFDDGDSFGNLVTEDEDGTLRYLSEFSIFEVMAEIGGKAGEAELPWSIWASYLTNTDAETDDDTGFLIGAKLGKAKELGSWQVSYDYRDLEADAAVGAFVDSDSGGGGTNIDGHRIKAAAGLGGNQTVGATLFLNSIDPDGADIDYTRVQVDYKVKF